MKKRAVLFFLLAAVLMLAACGKDPVDIQKEYVAMMEKPVSEHQIEKVEAYLKETIPNMSEEAADEMLIEYEAYLFPYYDGMIDYDKILQLYGSYASDDYRNLCAIKNKEQKKPATKAGKLTISRQELCNRAAEVEHLIRGEKEKKPIHQDADALYKTYIKLLLAGTADSPNFNLKSGRFLEDADKVYRTYAAENPDTVLADILSQYLEYVKNMHGTLDLKNAEAVKAYYSTCTYLEAEAGKRVME
ncbi:MAG: hypothetical protein SOR93_04080 [Clostridiales Family XIII bacterium]|nr:hypothetical protein [Clostridia bacterium]MDE8731993.1 hypothetical protein [Eubacteriales bacterium DFI.9.88]MDY3010427.1 hypothetical protein [Clostridiales Family XIII bacterium]